MTGRTAKPWMTLGQREKIVIKSCTRPFKTIYRMAWGTILRKSGYWMVRIGCWDILLPVAIDAIYSGHIESYKGLWLVTLVAVCSSVGSKQREAACLMNTCNIVYKPWCRSMAPFTICACCRLMHINMTFVALGSGFSEYEALMTLPAVYGNMLTGQGKLCLIMIKWIYCSVNLPSICTVASTATDLKIWAVRRFSFLVKIEDYNTKNKKQKSHLYFLLLI
jgi:hypothetical protein